jgi:DNA replication protein DnaC
LHNGKSHIAKTVAHAAIQTDYKVVYREAHTFFEDIFEASQLKRRKKVTKLFSEADLLMIDDLFLRKKVPEQAADDLLDIILNRYSYRKSSLISSNRPLEDWGSSATTPPRRQYLTASFTGAICSSSKAKATACRESE